MKRSPVQRFDTQTGRAAGMARVAGLTTVLAAAALLSACYDMLTLNPNREPVISISPSSFTVYPGDPVTFDSGDTTDPDDQQLEVQWEVVSAPAGSTYFLDNITSFAPSFVSYFRNTPGSDASDRYVVGPEDYSVPNYLGDYTLRKTVTDEYGVERSGEVTVTVANAAPGADAGSDSIGVIDPVGPDTLNLTGTGGQNEEESRRNTWQYRWNVTDQPAGSNLTLTNTSWTDPSDPEVASTAVADFTPLDTGVYTLSLEVRDEYGATSSNSMIVATTGNTVPVVGAPTVTVASDTITGAGTPGDPYRDNDTNVIDDADDTINLNGAITTNAEDDTMTVRWQVDSLPAAVEQLRFQVDGGGDQLYEAGDTFKSQAVIDGTELDFELDIAPATDLTAAFRNTDSTTDDAASYPDGTWDVAISIIANDGHLNSAPMVVHIDLYTIP